MAKQSGILDIGKEVSRNLLESMLLIRRFEEKAGMMYGIKKIGGFCHLYIGEEAVAAGSIKALDLSRDYIAAAYRDHGHALTCRMDPRELMAELYGKATGCSKGKGGSMHFFDKEKHMAGGNGIVGGQIPVATGFGLKIKYKKEDGVVLCYFGDGAIHQGSFHESLNLAKIYNLPVIYICENNQYGMGTDFRRVSSLEDFSQMGASYGIKGKQINGMDAVTVYREIKKAVEAARKDSQPRFFEIKTYRYRGHSMSDPAKYRTKKELESYKEQDPILILKKQMIEEGFITEDEYQTMDKDILARCDEAVSFAEESPQPDREQLYTDIIV